MSDIVFRQPRIPENLMVSMQELKASDPIYNPDNGGQFESGSVSSIDFKGCVLPLSDDDLKRAQQGTYTKQSRKIYTNGHALDEGSEVYVPHEDAIYTITGDLDHGHLHSMRRYTAERKGAAASK